MFNESHYSCAAILQKEKKNYVSRALCCSDFPVMTTENSKLVGMGIKLYGHGEKLVFFTASKHLSNKNNWHRSTVSSVDMPSSILMVVVVVVVIMSVGVSSVPNNLKLEILSADWAFMRLAFLQPKPHNIMFILSFTTRATNNPLVKV